MDVNTFFIFIFQTFILAVFVFGITVGKLVEKIERFLNENDDLDNIIGYSF